ncbi:hypothetical protein ADIS_4772 [Lunatimonas lonarensis]|uniref:Lipoprotein n=1 Tax=Lunatimonas lonarensis TaxID=1232681 RepID=R7ZL24_9BACT|nr:hypothetical protein [Lunatimonas lonarensis]EON74801.1 hypothetical protein ADIS_4772 [Lunatimonas lonarensis]
MKSYLLVIGTICMLIGCQEMEIEVADRPFLREKFNGKYELLSARSEVAIDLNNDGIASSNLLDENSTIWFSSLKIRIPDESEIFLKHNEFVFTEFWPTENDRRLRVSGFIPTYDAPVWGPYYDL